MSPYRILSPRNTLACLVTAAACANALAYDLTVEVLDARSDKGMVAGALYGSDATWLKQMLQGERQPAGPRAVLVYRNLQPGHYALSLLHDENGNGALDRNVAGTPTERYGFSRDAVGRMGPPAFADAAVDLQGDMTITVHLR
jgi:uncharacterized protein (DUF2141 family)